MAALQAALRAALMPDAPAVLSSVKIHALLKSCERLLCSHHASEAGCDLLTISTELPDYWKRSYNKSQDLS